jgi:DNA-binding NtrC family response regulator
MHSVPRILLVEPDDQTRGALEAAASPMAHVESFRDFETARARLPQARFDFLVTNVRLHAYNGLQLVYLSSYGRPAPQAIVYSAEPDPWLAREAERTGALYEIASSVPVMLAACLSEAVRSRVAARLGTP